VVEIASATAGVCCDGRQLTESIKLNATVGAAEDYPRGSLRCLWRLGVSFRLPRTGRGPETDCKARPPPPNSQTSQTENKLKFKIKEINAKTKTKRGVQKYAKSI
jgi:hypothetical protein